MKRFLCFAVCCLLFSCHYEQCGITNEPVLAVQFPFGTSSFSKVTVMGALKDIPVGGTSHSNEENGEGTFFPLNLNADSTTYIFTQPTRIDTLTVFYQKSISSASYVCGYFLDLEKPASGNLYKTTFKRIEVEYRSYYGYFTNPRSRNEPEGNGIFVKVNEL